MPSKQDLESLDSIFLAIMCKKLSQDASAAADIREQARRFKEEWFLLTETPGIDHSDDQMKSKLASLKSRMIDFLAPLI
jgi:hypothetical protein